MTIASATGPDAYADPFDSGIPRITISDIATRIDAAAAQNALARIMKTIGESDRRDLDTLTEIVEKVINHVVDLVPTQLDDPEDGSTFATPSIDCPDELGDFHPTHFWGEIAEYN
jgi:hypothetical protein